MLLLLGGRHPAQLRHQPRVADPHRAAVAEVLGVVLLRVQRQVARSLNIPPLVFYGGFMVNLNTAYRVCFEIKLLKHPVLTMFDCSTNQHGGAAPGSPQLVAVLALARVYQRGLGHLNIFRS